MGPFTALGQRFIVRCSDAALATWLDHLYSPMAAPDARGDHADEATPVVFEVRSPGEGTAGRVTRDGELVGSSRRRARVLGYLQWAVNRTVIRSAMTSRMVLHASAADLDGTAVVLPAVMESGKTTLVTGLLDRGLGYLTDEAAAVADDLTVEGYRKPLSIDPGSWEVLGHHRPELTSDLDGYLDDQWQVAPHDVGPVAMASRVGLLVFPTYEAGAPTRFTRLNPASAIAMAAPCTFGPEGQPIGVSRVRQLAALAAAVPAYRLVSGSLEEACEAVTGRLTQGE